MIWKPGWDLGFCTTDFDWDISFGILWISDFFIFLFCRGFLNIVKQFILNMIFVSSEISLETKLNTSLFFLFFYLIIHHFHDPYISSKLNLMETHSLIAANVTLFSGTLINCDSNSYFQFILSSVIIVSNIYFVWECILYIFWIYIIKNYKFFKVHFPRLTKMLILVTRGKDNIFS